MAWQTDRNVVDYLQRRIKYYKKKRGRIKSLLNDVNYMDQREEINTAMDWCNTRIIEYEQAVNILEQAGVFAEVTSVKKNTSLKTLHVGVDFKTENQMQVDLVRAEDDVLITTLVLDPPHKYRVLEFKVPDGIYKIIYKDGLSEPSEPYQISVY